MDVKFENKIRTELFCNIQAGECFATDLNTPDQIICMKVWGDIYGDANAVGLEAGTLLYFEDDEIVTPIKTELKVRLDG